MRYLPLLSPYRLAITHEPAVAFTLLHFLHNTSHPSNLVSLGQRQHRESQSAETLEPMTHGSCRVCMAAWAVRNRHAFAVVCLDVACEMLGCEMRRRWHTLHGPEPTIAHRDKGESTKVSKGAERHARAGLHMLYITFFTATSSSIPPPCIICASLQPSKAVHSVPRSSRST